MEGINERKCESFLFYYFIKRKFFSVSRRCKTPFESKSRLYPVPRSSEGVFAKLNEFVAEMRQYSWAESTQWKYINEFHCFGVWCDKAALPASPETVERYCAAVLMSKDDPSPGPILNMIPAIAKFYVIRGLSNPCDDQAWRSSSKP